MIPSPIGLAPFHVALEAPEQNSFQNLSFRLPDVSVGGGEISEEFS